MHALKHRLINGLAMAALVMAVLFLATSGLALAVVVLISAWCMLEYYSMLDRAGIPNFRFFGILSGSLLLTAVWGIDQFGWSEEVLSLSVFLIAFALFIRQFPQRHNTKPMETLAGTLLGVIYIAFFMSFFLRLLMIGGPMAGRWLLFYLFAVVKLNDTGAYFSGSLLGKHKMFPRLSPGKSWEGFAGGAITGVAVSLGIRALGGGQVGPLTMSVGHAAILGLLLSVSGVLGDLFESMLKRAAGAKDSGAVFKGQGGALDILDSLLPSAAILYFYGKWWLL